MTENKHQRPMLIATFSGVLSRGMHPPIRRSDYFRDSSAWAVRDDWRKRVGVEPTILAAKDRINGFEGHEDHRAPGASAVRRTQRIPGLKHIHNFRVRSASPTFPPLPCTQFRIPVRGTLYEFQPSRGALCSLIIKRCHSRFHILRQSCPSIPDSRIGFRCPRW